MPKVQMTTLGYIGVRNPYLYSTSEKRQDINEGKWIRSEEKV
ncbi:MAG: hypothetical protein ACLUUO_10100 [Sellimonas intestinalis]